MKNNYPNWKTKLWAFMLTVLLFGFSAKATVWPIPNTDADTLRHFIEATSKWNPGDTIMLVDDGVYAVDSVTDILQTITIMGDPDLVRCPEVNFLDNGFRVLKDLTSISIKNLKLNGFNADSTHRAEFAVLYRMYQSYMSFNNIKFEHVEAWGFRGGIDLEQNKHCYYDSIIINNVVWHDFLGDYAIDPNINFAKYIRVTNSTFYNLGTGFQKNPDFTQSPPNDTLIPKVFIYDHNTFYKVAGNNNSLIQVNDPKDQSVTLTFTNNIVSKLFHQNNARPFRIDPLAGTFNFAYSNIHQFEVTDPAKVIFNFDSVVMQPNVDAVGMLKIDPGFADTNAYDFSLFTGNPMLGAGSDGGPIGDPRWVKGEKPWVPGPGCHLIPNTSADTLEHFIEDTTYWNPGDTIVLISAGEYVVNHVIDVKQGITVMGDPRLSEKPRVTLLDNGFRVIEDSLSVAIKNLTLNGYNADSTHRAEFILLYRLYKSYQTFYKIDIDNVEAWGFRGGIDLEQNKHCYYDTILVNNVIWHDFLGDYAIDPNINFAKYLKVTNSTFYDLGTGFVKNPDFLQAAPNDTLIHKTYIIDHNTFFRVAGNNNSFIQVNDPKDESVTLTCTNNIVCRLFHEYNARPFRIDPLAGDFTIAYNAFYRFDVMDAAKDIFNLDSVALQANVHVNNIQRFYPGYADTVSFDFTIPDTSSLYSAGSDGGAIGDPRWAPKAAAKVVSIEAVLIKVVEGIDLQLKAVVTLEGSVDKTVTWSVENAWGGTTGAAAIDAATGLLSPTAAGKVRVKATSNYNNAFYDTIIVTIEAKTLVTSITLAATNAQGNPATEITNKGGFLTITATILPGNADDKSITWSLSGDGKATITPKTPTTAELVAVQCGDVVVKATANDGSGTVDELTIPISGQTPVTSVTVTGEGGATTITVNGGTLQMIATVTPDTACIKEVTWSVDKSEVATISATGLLTAVSNGTVTVTARATDGSYKTGTLDITISNQGDLVHSLTVDEIRIVPNPAVDFFVVKADQRSEVTISNITGAVVLVTEVDPNIAVPVTDLKPGLYIVNVKAGDQTRMFRLVKH
jgi:uncharacterized protein YjdB